MKNFWLENNKVNKKKVLISVIIALVLICVITSICIYVGNKQARVWIDKNILRKEVMQEKLSSIEINDENAQVYAFNQNIGVLSKNNFKIYNSSGNEEKNLNMEITTPLFNSNNRFLAVAQKSGQKVYLVTNKDITWEKKVEGNISQIHVNKNGYVAVVVTNTSYKTVVEMYSPTGEELFKTYLSSTRTADVSISNDNKYLAIGEIDTSGTVIQSTIKIVSISKAKEDPLNSIEKTYKAENNKLLTNIVYQEKNKLVCMYTDSITVIDNEKEELITDYNSKKITFSSVDLNISSVTIEEKSSGLFTADSVVNIVNSDNKEKKEYIAKDVAKEIYTNGNIVGLNLGTEIDFISTDGWLVKKYIANQEITKVVLSGDIAGVVYRGKIEIIKL